MKTIADWIIKLRWLIIVSFILITVVFARQIPKATFNSDMLSYLPENMTSRVNSSRIEELFGGSEMIMVLLQTDDILNPETLKRVKKMSGQMKRIKGIDKVMSLFELKHVKSEDGAMVVNPAVKRIPKTKKERASLREEIKSNDIVYGNVVSKDFTLTAVIGMVEQGISDKTLIADIEKLIGENPGNEEVTIGGTPYSRYNTGNSTKKDLGRLLPIGLLIMLLFLFICFKQLRGVFLPFLVVLMSIMFSMGLIPLFGWQITVITIILPVILIAVANDYGIHMIAKYQEDNIAGHPLTNKDLAKQMFRNLGSPVLLTGLTTMVGMLCLQGHIMVPAGQLGVLAAAGILFALAASLFFIPAVVSLLPKTKPVMIARNNNRKKPVLERILTSFGDLVTIYPQKVIFIALSFTAISVLGIFNITVNTDPINYYEKDHPVARSANMINTNLGGFFPVSVVFEGDIKDPRVLKKIDKLEREIENFPQVGNTMSIARIVRQISRVLNEKGEKYYDVIPDTRNAVAQYFELYTMSSEPEDFEKMVDFPYEHAIVTARINTSSTPVLRKVVDRINDMVKNDPDVRFVGGIADIFSDLSAKTVNGQFISLGIALVAVTLLLMLVFRSFTAGCLASIPLVLSMTILFGLMGILNIELNVTTALLSSIMIGVGIDYTIHFLWRYKEERQNGLTYTEAARHTLLTTGRGIMFNAFSVIIGFVVLLISSFVPVRFFGFLVVVSIFACLVGALVFIPALCIVLKPNFLEPKETVNKIQVKKKFSIRNKIMKNMKFYLLIVMFCFSVSTLSAQNKLTAKQIQEKSIEATSVSGTEAVTTMIIIDSKGRERIRKIAQVTKMFDNGKTEKKLIRFLAPADVKGTGFLTFDYRKKDDEKWLYMPALRKARRIVSSENAKSFMGSEFSYADITPLTVENFSYRILGQKDVNSVNCWEIEIVPVDENIADENGFSKKVSFIAKSDFVIRKAVYYDLDGELHKEMTVKEIREVDVTNHKYRLIRLIMENKQNDRKSIMNIEKIQYNPNVKNEFFTTRYLARE